MTHRKKNISVASTWDSTLSFISYPRFMNVGEDRYKDWFKNLQLGGVWKLPSCDHKPTKLTLNYVAFALPIGISICLFRLPSRVNTIPRTWNFPHSAVHFDLRRASGVGAKSADPGPSRKCRPLAGSDIRFMTSSCSVNHGMIVCFEDVFARTSAKFSVNCRLLNLPEHHAAGPNAQLQLVIATRWWYRQSIRTGNNYYKKKTLSWTGSKLRKDYKATTN